MTLVHKARYQRWLQSAPAGRYVVRIERYQEPRSLVSNRYYFGAVVRTIGQELGYADPREMHDILAMKFLRLPDCPKTGMPRRQRTRNMKQKPFTKYVNDVITWAEADMQIRIPTPEEWRYGVSALAWAHRSHS